jgi:hypothetical protein
MKRIALLLVMALFGAFVFAQTKTEVKPADLSKDITTYIAKDYAGYSIEKAFKEENKGVMTWEVEIMKGHEKHMLVFDKDGKFVKKESMKSEEKSMETKPAKASGKTETAPKK